MTSHLDKVKFQQVGEEMQGGMPILSDGINHTTGGGLHKFENFIVPMGLIVENRPSVMHKMAMMENGYHNVISDSMFDNLYKNIAK